MLSRFPDMPSDEADYYLSRVEHEENIPICQAVIGRISRDDLSAGDRVTFDEFQRWAADKTRRTRNEQWSARKRREQTKLALNMTKMHERGLVSDQALLMFGISGEMPESGTYMAMSPEEKEALWNERMELRFGPNWTTRIEIQRQNNQWRPFRCRRRYERTDVNWKTEGF